MSKIPPPLLGYNNNVRYRGRTFHIQTEDSGTKYARIVTHLFVDGGRIVKSIRTQYTEVLSSLQMAETVRQMMKEQHKGMFLSLRAGEFDEAILRIVGPETVVAQPPAAAGSGANPPNLAQGFPAAEVTTAIFASPMDGSDMPPSRSPVDLPTPAYAGVAASGIPAEVSLPPGAPMRSRELPPASSRPASRPSSRLRRSGNLVPPGTAELSPVSSRDNRVVDDPTPVEFLPPATPVPASRPSERPPRSAATRSMGSHPEILDPRNQSIFGETGEGRQTLDEVILSFLEDEEP